MIIIIMLMILICISKGSILVPFRVVQRGRVRHVAIATPVEVELDIYGDSVITVYSYMCEINDTRIPGLICGRSSWVWLCGCVPFPSAQRGRCRFGCAWERPRHVCALAFCSSSTEGVRERERMSISRPEQRASSSARP